MIHQWVWKSARPIHVKTFPANDQNTNIYDPQDNLPKNFTTATILQPTLTGEEYASINSATETKFMNCDTNTKLSVNAPTLIIKSQRDGH